MMSRMPYYNSQDVRDIPFLYRGIVTTSLPPLGPIAQLHEHGHHTKTYRWHGGSLDGNIVHSYKWYRGWYYTVHIILGAKAAIIYRDIIRRSLPVEQVMSKAYHLHTLAVHQLHSPIVVPAVRIILPSLWLAAELGRQLLASLGSNLSIPNAQCRTLAYK